MNEWKESMISHLNNETKKILNGLVIQLSSNWNSSDRK